MKGIIRLLAIVGTAAVAHSIFAQDTPDTSRGFMPQNVYDFRGMDTVAMFNGNLNVHIPLGQTYRVNGRMPYQFGLFYNSNNWDYEQQNNGGLVAVPFGRSNAGFGWTFSLGEFYGEDPYNRDPLHAIYVSPDGAEHTLGGTNATYGYSADASQLRVHFVNNYTDIVEFPDGAKHTFTRLQKRVGDDWIADSNGTTWRLTAMADAFGNTLSIRYTTVNDPNDPSNSYAEVWTMKDGPRTHTAYFVEGTFYPTALDHLDVTTAGGSTATYRFHYQTASIPQGFGATSSAPYTLSLLTSIDLPDGSAYYMTTDGTATGAPAYATATGTNVPGVMQSLRLPTGGYLKWAYEPRTRPYSGPPPMPQRPGVVTRLQCGSDGCPTPGSELGKWTYHTFYGAVGCTYDGAGRQGTRQLTTWVTQPDGVTSLAYFNAFLPDTDVCYADQPLYQIWDYGIPFAPEASGPGGYLSTETRSTFSFPTGWTGIGRAPGSFDALTQSRYITYDTNATSQWSGSMTNPVKVVRTNYDGDNGCGGVCYKQSNNYTYDGFGHYRQTSTDTNFPGAFKFRTTFTDYATTLDASSDWVLGTATEQCSADESVVRATALTSCSSLTASATTKLNVDRTTGALLGRRVLKNTNNTLNAHDVLTLFSYDSHGNPATEQFYGADAQSIDTSAAFPTPPATPTYQIDHTATYAGGALASRSSAYKNFQAVPPADFAFTLDSASFDPYTGLPSSTRDAAGVQTGYSYDSMGRLTGITPPSPLAGTVLTYSRAILSGTTLTPANVDVTTAPADATKGKVEKKYLYDALGRLFEEHVLMPSKDANGANTDIWSKVQTLYNASGQRASVSTQQSVAAFNAALNTSFFYDASGKPSVITTPDGKQTTFSRIGDRVETRTMAIATSATGTTSSPTTYTYDQLGRIFRVEELAGPTSASATTGTTVTTDYTYDWADRLTSVLMSGDSGSQSRTFNYDTRGFLTAETHPESGTTSYDGFDARGHATHRVVGPFDLTFEYDDAERLIHVKDLAGSTRRALKDFTFLDENSGSDYSRGKLRTAIRYNHPPSGDVSITETYTYAGPGGTVSTKETSIVAVGGPSQTFTESFTYDDLGALGSITYPTCLAPCAASGGIGTLNHGLYNGQLVSVVPYASSLTYNANGTLATVKHQGSVKDTYAADPNGMPRPQSISVSGFTCSPTASIVNAPATMCANTTSTATASPSTGATFLWTIDNGSIISGGFSATVTFTAPAGTAVLHLKITTCGDAFAQTSINVTPSASITQQPASTSIASGSSTTLSVAASASNPHYQWYQGTPPGGTPLSGQTSSTFTTPALTQTTTYWVRVTSDCGIADSNAATVTIVNIPAPTGLTATTQASTSSVLVHWNAVPSASSYIVEFATNVAGPFIQLGQSTTSVQVLHSSSPTSAPLAYVYRVWSADSNGVRGSVSNMDYAVTASTLFSDEPIQKGLTPIRGIHVKQVRDAIDAVRAAASTAQNPLPPVWPNAASPTGGIAANTFTSLIAPLNAARSVFGLPSFAYTGVPSPAVNGSIMSEHIQQLRDALR